jgi:hypothetical protein
MAIYFPFFLFTCIVGIIGLICDNKMTRWIWEKDNNCVWASLSVGIIFLYVFYIRYFKRISAKELTERVKILHGARKIILKTLVYFFIIVVPIASFIFSRLYLIRWRYPGGTIFHN